jgi:hypothetical protein
MPDATDDRPARTKTTSRPPAPRTGWWWLALVLTGLLVLVLAITVGISVSKTLAAQAKASTPPATSSSPWALPGLGIDPLAPPDGGAITEEDEANVRAFFARFGTAVRDPKGVPDDLIDWSELAEAVPDDAVPETREAHWYGRQVVQSEQTVWRQWNWIKFDVRKVTRRPDGAAIEAVVVHTARDGKTAKRRWTLTGSPDGLQVLGWEDLRTGMTARYRAYARAAAATSPSLRRQRNWRYEQVPEVHRLIDQTKWEEATARLNELKAVKFDGDLQYAVDLAEGRLALHYRLSDDGDWDDELAVEILEELVSKHPERLAAYPLLAETHLKAEEYRRAIEVCDACLSVTGPDADVLALRGAAHAALLEHAEAEDDFTAAEKLDRYQPRAVNYRRQLANPAGKKAIADTLATAPDPAALVDALVGGATTDQDWAGVRELAERYRALRPKESRWVHPLVVALLETENADDAVTAFKAGVKLATDDERATLVKQFARVMIAHGQADRVYAAVPPADARSAFRVLAEHLESRRLRLVVTTDDKLTEVREAAVKALLELIATHRKAHPDDPHLALHDGRLKFDRKQYKQAADVFAPALAKLTRTGDAIKDTQSGYLPLRRELVLARYKAGEAVEAFREVKPQVEVFDQLVELLLTDKDAAGLTKLLDARKQAGGGTPHELYWRAEADRLAKRHADAAKKYGEYLKADEPNGFQWTARTQRVRCLVRADDLSAAERELKDSPLGEMPVELRALVLAKTGHPADAEQLLREHLTPRPWAVGLYLDEDLGPLLKGDPAFAVFRKDFPPPDIKPQPPR